jgi:hypothetical protein
MEGYGCAQKAKEALETRQSPVVITLEETTNNPVAYVSCKRFREGKNLDPIVPFDPYYTYGILQYVHLCNQVRRCWIPNSS